MTDGHQSLFRLRRITVAMVCAFIAVLAVPNAIADAPIEVRDTSVSGEISPIAPEAASMANRKVSNGQWDRLESESVIRILQAMK